MTREILVTYFSGEKRESVAFMAIAVVAIAAALVLWRGSGPFRGAAWPLVIVAVIQLVVGGTIYFRTDGQVESLIQRLDGDPSAMQRDESARMEKVMTSFRLYKMIEVALILVAIGLLIFTRPPAIAAGVGLGLLLQASVMLTADIVAEHRGATYVAALRR